MDQFFFFRVRQMAVGRNWTVSESRHRANDRDQTHRPCDQDWMMCGRKWPREEPEAAQEEAEWSWSYSGCPLLTPVFFVLLVPELLTSIKKALI